MSVRMYKVFKDKESIITTNIVSTYLLDSHDPPEIEGDGDEIQDDAAPHDRQLGSPLLHNLP